MHNSINHITTRCCAKSTYTNSIRKNKILLSCMSKFCTLDKGYISTVSENSYLWSKLEKIWSNTVISNPNTQLPCDWTVSMQWRWNFQSHSNNTCNPYHLHIKTDTLNHMLIMDINKTKQAEKYLMTYVCKQEAILPWQQSFLCCCQLKFSCSVRIIIQ